jgi:putative oxidoreductase
MSELHAAAPAVRPGPVPYIVPRFVALRGFAGRLPQPILDLAFRIGVGSVFFKSGLVKIADWPTTVLLFSDEYRVPILPPEIAAPLAAAAELTCPVLLVLGLGARFGAAVLFAMTAVIQIFVYPLNWSEHLIWAALLAHILTRGPGWLSVDHLIARRFLGNPGGRAS